MAHGRFHIPQPGLLTHVPKTPRKVTSTNPTTSKLPTPTSEMCSLQRSEWLLAGPHLHNQAHLRGVALIVSSLHLPGEPDVPLNTCLRPVLLLMSRNQILRL